MQDTPAAKLTYSAAITVPTPLTALMSAVPQNSPKGSADGAATHTFKFKQEVPIPSYLLALAVGDLEHRQIGPKSKVRHTCIVWDPKHPAGWVIFGWAQFKYLHHVCPCCDATDICYPNAAI